MPVSMGPTPSGGNVRRADDEQSPLAPSAIDIGWTRGLGGRIGPHAPAMLRAQINAPLRRETVGALGHGRTSNGLILEDLR